jgi:HAD superfamily hydrolase (TIGR01509 family)
VVFDLDGVLIDSEPIFEEAGRCMLERRGLAWAPEVVRGMMGSPARQAFDYFREFYRLEDSVTDLIAEGSLAFHTVLGQGTVPFLAGAVALLDRLRDKGVPVAMATSSSRAYVEKVLRPHAPFLGRFHFVLTCDDVARGKPDPEIYRKAAARLGHAPADMVVIEDSPNGLRAAQAAGARCLVVPHRRVWLDDVARADALVPSLADQQVSILLGL